LACPGIGLVSERGLSSLWGISGVLERQQNVGYAGLEDERIVIKQK
jgi:hypothetical protein